MYKSLIYFILLFCCETKSQINLVPNGSFEEYSSCPVALTDPYVVGLEHEIDKCIGWTYPTSGSSDYFNVCALGTDAYVPNNIFGSQNPKDGNAYCGFFAYYGNTYCEYIQAKLIKHLQAGKKYTFTCSLSLNDSAGFAINKLGALFSSNPIGLRSSLDYIINVNPQIESKVIFADKVNWMTLTGSFLADGGEEYITIGRFNDNSTIDTTTFSNDPNYGYSYYYIDDVGLVENELFNVLTPNGDGANDVINFSNYQFSKMEFTVYNRWGTIEFSTTDTTLKWGGTNLQHEKLVDGTYYYILKANNSTNNELVFKNYLHIFN